MCPHLSRLATFVDISGRRTMVDRCVGCGMVAMPVPQLAQFLADFEPLPGLVLIIELGREDPPVPWLGYPGPGGLPLL